MDTRAQDTLYRVLCMQYLFLTQSERISIMDMICEINDAGRTKHAYEKWDMSNQMLTRGEMFSYRIKNL